MVRFCACCGNTPALIVCDTCEDEYYCSHDCEDVHFRYHEFYCEPTDEIEDSVNGIDENSIYITCEESC